MTKFVVRIDKRVYKELSKLLPKHLNQIKEDLESLSSNPRPQDCRKLKVSGGYRITTGEYRILYTIDDQQKVVSVYRIVKRNDFSYRD